MVKVAISGYFDPLHVGHIELIEKSKLLGDYLIVIVNNDRQLALKRNGQKPLMPDYERVKVLAAIKGVDEAFLSIDEDRTVCKSLEAVHPDIFANGGDRHQGEIPESEVCRKLGIKMVDGQGDKIQSSSILLKEWEKSKSQS
ncbi:MAG: adenylyltransferase/cytidyltransferase family protein [Candidatus Pacearchaeota archaeon]|jgi:cytidyltransferase-like protein